VLMKIYCYKKSTLLILWRNVWNCKCGIGGVEQGGAANGKLSGAILKQHFGGWGRCAVKVLF